MRRLVAGVLLLAAALAAPAAAVAGPAGCANETYLPSGAVDPTGLCVSYGYGVRPANQPLAPATRNVVARAEGKVAMPFDYYVRSDVAAQIAAGTARPRAAYLLLFGGAFVCGSRADMAPQARELASRGYIVIAPEYPLAGVLGTYGYYKPTPSYSQESFTARGANSCDTSGFLQQPAWRSTYLPRLKQYGLDPELQASQWILQQLVRVLKTNRSYGVDPKRIFALGSSAGGSVALRLALGGDRDRLPSGSDPGDSTIAGAIGISGPSCFPGSTKITTPMLYGQIRPSEYPACRLDADAADPPVMMIQEPRGGADDPVVPSGLTLAGCAAINAAGGKCLYEDRTIAAGGYLADGAHATLTWANWLRLFTALQAGTVGNP